MSEIPKKKRKLEIEHNDTRPMQAENDCQNDIGPTTSFEDDSFGSWTEVDPVSSVEDDGSNSWNEVDSMTIVEDDCSSSLTEVDPTIGFEDDISISCNESDPTTSVEDDCSGSLTEVDPTSSVEDDCSGSLTEVDPTSRSSIIEDDGSVSWTEVDPMPSVEDDCSSSLTEVDPTTIVEGDGSDNSTKTILAKCSSSKDSISKIIHLSGPSKENVEDIYNQFWKLTTRTKKSNKEEDFGPRQFHKWGSLNKISERSPTLKQILDTGGLENVINCRESINNILKELHLEYNIVEQNSRKEHTIVMVYDIKSNPNLSFYGFGVNKEAAEEASARKALNFFTEMSH